MIFHDIHDIHWDTLRYIEFGVHWVEGWDMMNGPLELCRNIVNCYGLQGISYDFFSQGGKYGIAVAAERNPT